MKFRLKQVPVAYRGLVTGLIMCLVGLTLLAVSALASGQPDAEAGGNAATNTKHAHRAAGNWNFERGDLAGWYTRSRGSGAWYAYADGTKPPNPAETDPDVACFVPASLEFDGCEADQQFRVDLMDPAAPADSMAAKHVLATIFKTAPGDPSRLAARTVTFDLSQWAGERVRIRFAQVDNRGPLRAGVDDVLLMRIGS